ncbi:MAG TPA: hypothetical protein VE954_24095 [Oligoflexus sp.]|nr:hypothetical protein [Oligoflexus sp.]HYX36196.1 hypothetical protein [Oligoflexus sp.]
MRRNAFDSTGMMEACCKFRNGLQKVADIDRLGQIFITSGKH